MTTTLAVTRHRISIDPAANIVLPGAWRPLLVAGQDGFDGSAMSDRGPAISDPAELDQYRRLLKANLDDSQRHGVTFVALLSGQAELPVAASLLVTPIKSVEPITLWALEDQWNVESARHVERIALPIGPALLGVEERDVVIDDFSSVSVYDWQIAVLRSAHGGLMLAFSTPLVPIKEIFDEVFLAITRTVRWSNEMRES